MVPTRAAAVALAALVAVLAAGALRQPEASAAFPPKRVLVFTKTSGIRHASIPAAAQAITALGRWASFAVDLSEEESSFTDANLARYDVVVFASTSGDVLGVRARAAFQRYIRAGGGFVGIHSAADTERNWPWYVKLVGAVTVGHTDVQRASIDVANPRDSTTDHLPPRWTREDEWYGFQPNPRTNGVRVLLTLDESTYEPGESAMGGDHPIAWSHEYDGGRAWYTAGGGNIDSYTDPVFLEHVLDGIRWASNNGKKRVQPKVVSVATELRARRVTVTVTHANCVPCSGRVSVRSRSTLLRFKGTRATALTQALPPGRWQLTLFLRDRTTGLATTVRRFVQVR